MALTVEALSGEPYNQAHIFEGASDEVKEGLVKQLNDIDAKLPGGGLKGYLERARGLLADAQAGKNPFAGKTPVFPTGERLTGEESGPGSAQYAELEKTGMAQLSKCAFCLVAGGLGERLGFPGIKIGITSEVTTGATFIESYAKFILAFQAYARRETGSWFLELPLAIMTSGDTHEKTVELLEGNKFFGLSKKQVVLLKQELVPALRNVQAHIAVTDGKVETKPHGHGDVHALLYQNGLPQKWAKEGKEWLLLFQDTNPLPFRSLCAVLGVSAKNGFVMNSITVPRNPKEAIGGICTLQDPGQEGGLTINVEYNQLDPLLKTTKAGGDVADESGFSPFPGNINVLVFKLKEMAECLETSGGIVPEFVNPKWKDERKMEFKSPTRLECMMQDFPRLCKPEHPVGFSQVERLMCFTCVKNNLKDAATKTPPDCALSAEADIYACNAKLLQLAGQLAGQDVRIEPPGEVSFLGIKASIGARIVLEPSFAVSLEQLKEKIKGPVRISAKSSLVLAGDATLDGLELDGALEVSGNGEVKDKKVSNAGQPLEAIPEAELSDASELPPSLKIRGYRASAGEKETLILNKSPLEAVADSARGVLTCCTSRSDA